MSHTHNTLRFLPPCITLSTQTWTAGAIPEHCLPRHVSNSISKNFPLLLSPVLQPHWPRGTTCQAITWEHLQQPATESFAGMKSKTQCYECPYFLSFSLSLCFKPSLLFSFPLCCPQTSICLPFALWLLYLDMTHYDSFNKSYLLLDLWTSDDSLYESSLYLAHNSYRLWLTCSYY